MTPEQLDEIEKLAEADMSEPWSEAESAYVMALQRYALPLVKALREARARCETLRELADEKAYAAGLFARRMEEAQKARSEALAEAKKWHLKYDCLKGDADVAVMEMNAAVEFADNAKAEVERLREAVRQVHALAEKTMLDAWCVGIGRETLRDIHKITKGMVE